jgi:predicted transcriptional regulator
MKPPTASQIKRVLKKMVREGTVEKVPGVNPKTGRLIWIYQSVKPKNLPRND